jgi:spore coat polysaccharide biosynthesis predicted glycosyltransferase SpsG
MRNYKLCFELADTVGDIIIYKHKDNFEIIFTNEYTCYVSDYQQKYCLVQHEDNRGIFDVYFIPYEELGVKNLDELFQLLVLKPEEMIKTITENDIPINRLIIEYSGD